MTDLNAMRPEEYRDIRERLNLSQEALARRLNLSTSTIQKRESGASAIDYEAAIAITALLEEDA